MNPVKGNIIVSVDLFQKSAANQGGIDVSASKTYNENFRERNPVIAKVEKGNDEIPSGSYIVCNYSHFDLESPNYLYGDIYSICADEEIYAIVNQDGSLKPIMGNVFVERVTKDSVLPLPEELKKPHMDRGILLTETEVIPSGSFVFWLKMADYQICYTWKGVERTALKIHKSEITGYLKKY